MLHLVYGDIDEFNKVYDTEYVTLYRINDHFDNLYTHEWLNNKFAKKVIQEVDKSEHIKDDLIDSPYRGCISPKQLSGGVKTLITLDNDRVDEDEEPLILYGTNMGDNCTNGLVELANKKDIWININHLLMFEKGKSINAIILNSGIKVSNTTDLNSAIIDVKSEWHLYTNKLYNRT